MTVIGADPAALDDVAGELAAAADWLRSTRWNRPIAGMERLDQWHGPDADALMARLAEVTADRRRAGDVLEQCAASLRRAAVEQRRASTTAPRHAVPVDLPGGGGRLVQRIGDDSAAVVVVLVPGVGTDRDDRDRLQADAERVWRHLADRVDDARSVAVVSWLGYDPPDHLVGAVDLAPAEDGAVALAAEVRSLRRAGVQRVTVVGHSFGGVVTGRAVLAGMDADVVVQLGSPGTGAPGVDVAAAARGIDLRAVRAVGDPIGLVAGRVPGLYGPDGVGLVASVPTAATGHGSYLRDDALLDALSQLATDLGRSDAR